jgi:hypothetical protein
MADNSSAELQRKERARSHEPMSSRTDTRGDAIRLNCQGGDGSRWCRFARAGDDVKGGWRQSEPAPPSAFVARLADGFQHIPNAASHEARKKIWSSNASAERGDEVKKARRALKLKAHSVAFRVTEEEWQKSKSSDYAPRGIPNPLSRKRKRGPAGPRPQLDPDGQVFSSSTVLPRGLRISST